MLAAKSLFSEPWLSSGWISLLAKTPQRCVEETDRIEFQIADFIVNLLGEISIRVVKLLLSASPHQEQKRNQEGLFDQIGEKKEEEGH